MKPGLHFVLNQIIFHWYRNFFFMRNQIFILSEPKYYLLTWCTYSVECIANIKGDSSMPFKRHQNILRSFTKYHITSQSQSRRGVPIIFIDLLKRNCFHQCYRISLLRNSSFSNLSSILPISIFYIFYRYTSKIATSYLLLLAFFIKVTIFGKCLCFDENNIFVRK